MDFVSYLIGFLSSNPFWLLLGLFIGTLISGFTSILIEYWKVGHEYQFRILNSVYEPLLIELNKKLRREETRNENMLCDFGLDTRFIREIKDTVEFTAFLTEQKREKILYYLNFEDDLSTKIIDYVECRGQGDKPKISEEEYQKISIQLIDKMKEFRVCLVLEINNIYNSKMLKLLRVMRLL